VVTEVHLVQAEQMEQHLRKLLLHLVVVPFFQVVELVLEQLHILLRMPLVAVEVVLQVAMIVHLETEQVELVELVV
jgi:hypothetical protein